MGVVSSYLSDDEVVSVLRQEFDREFQFSIDFYYWLHTARKVKDGVLVDVMGRCFLLNEFTGYVIREIYNGGCCC